MSRSLESSLLMGRLLLIGLSVHLESGDSPEKDQIYQIKLKEIRIINAV